MPTVKPFAEWEEVVYEKTTKKRGDFDVRLEKCAKSSLVKSRLVISHRLAEELCWTDGTTVSLYKAGPLFLLRAKSSGIETLKSHGKYLYLTSQTMVLHMGLPVDLVQSNEPLYFEAYTDLTGDGSLIFKLKE